jgi:hypothetical protein
MEKIETWKYNFNYWTGAMTPQNASKMFWCPQNTDALSNFLDLDGSAKLSNVDSCMRLKITPKNASVERTIKWGYKNCSWRFLPACKVTDKVNGANN